MATINTAPTISLDAEYKLLEKYVKTYIESGNLKTLYDWFESEGVDYGKGYEVNIVFSQKKYVGSGRAPEHGTFNTATLEVIINEAVKGQYAITIDKRKLAKYLANGGTVQQYASELVESLMQGYIDDKNENMENVFLGIATNSKDVIYTAPTDEKARALKILQLLNQKLMEMKKNIKVSAYNTALVGVQDRKITTDKIAIVMTCEMASILDAYGFAQTITPEYMELNGIKRFEVVDANVLGGTNKILVTDARNVALKPINAPFSVQIENSDGTTNEFLNVEYYCDYLGNATDGLAFPSYLIKPSNT